MCGITGVFGDTNDNDLTRVVGAMAASLAHRGPDDGGVWSDGKAHIALGHQRLSVIDLSQEGHQPMHSACGRYIIVFNGEIYNHKTLRKELENEFASSHLPRSRGVAGWCGQSDTETLLTAISCWGIEATLKRVVGMFAIAVWDRSDRRLCLVRDRMGEKPLYYGWCNGRFVFGSELKAVCRYPGFSNEIDRDSLTLYLRHNYVPAPYSIYKNILKLEPGCLLSLKLEDTASRPSLKLRAPASEGSLRLTRWWSLHEVVEDGRASRITDEKEALVLLESQLRESIRLQLAADVPLGVFLSGGVDSSLIVALMQSEANTPVSTYTIGFSEANYDEAVYARSVASHLQTDHTELYLSAAVAQEVIPLLPTLYDEPFADSSQIPTFLVAQMAKKYVTVALSGDAGDELFAGYNRHFKAPGIWKIISKVPTGSRQLISKAINVFSPQTFSTLEQGLSYILPKRWQITFLGDKLLTLANCLGSVKDSDDLYYSLVSEWNNPGEIVIGEKEPTTLLTRRSEWPVLPDFEERMMYLDAMTYLPDDILVKVDRAAMGVGLETRVPFLDYRIVELAWRLPLSMKINHGQGKQILRDILYKYVPRKLIERPKQGFGIPLGDWLRGPLRDWAETLLDESLLKRQGFFNPEPILLRWKEHLAYKHNWEHSLWGVLMFQAWLENK